MFPPGGPEGPPLRSATVRLYVRQRSALPALLARRRLPLRGIRLALEVRAAGLPRVEVLRVIDDGRDEQVRVTVRLADAAEIFRDDSAGAVGDAVPLQVPGSHAGRHDLQLRGGNRFSRARPAATGVLPRRHRHALQAPVGRRRARDGRRARPEREPAGLLPPPPFHLPRVFRLPPDVPPRRPPPYVSSPPPFSPFLP